MRKEIVLGFKCDFLYKINGREMFIEEEWYVFQEMFLEWVILCQQFGVFFFDVIIYYSNLNVRRIFFKNVKYIDFKEEKGEDYKDVREGDEEKVAREVVDIFFITNF